MLDVAILNPDELDRAAKIFHRDGFVCVRNPLTSQQFAAVKAGCDRIVAEQTSATALEQANRGFARYSFGDQLQHPEWQMLVDLPTIEPIITHIWGNDDYTCMGGGGDYSLPGAKIQHLHSDIREFIHDPQKLVTFQDMPTPFIVVNFTMIDFTRENGAIRFVPCTHRSRAAIPSLEDEPQWMRDSILCAPANTAVIRDVRCWHAGTANQSRQIRPMVSVGYYAPWHRARHEPIIPRELYRKMSPRAQKLCRLLAGD